VIAELVAQLRHDVYDELATSGSPTDAYAVARELGYRKGWNDRAHSIAEQIERTERGLRELREAVPTLFEAVDVEGEWE